MNPDDRFIFLSAGVPEKILDDGTEDQSPYVVTAVPDLIRESVLSLIAVCCERQLGVVFGGHPAISPLVHHACDRLGMIPRVHIYQSEFFLKRPDIVPAAAWAFPNLHRTRDEGNLESSVSQLRNQMINAHEWNFVAGVFIGGKKGIPDEFERFRQAYDSVPRFPLFSPGGAAQDLFSKFATQMPGKLMLDALPESKRPTYKLLFRDLLPT
jgi:hypothetical protein